MTAVIIPTPIVRQVLKIWGLIKTKLRSSFHRMELEHGRRSIIIHCQSHCIPSVELQLRCERLLHRGAYNISWGKILNKTKIGIHDRIWKAWTTGWCREEGFMTGKFDGKTEMQQRMLENEKKGKKFSVVEAPCNLAWVDYGSTDAWSRHLSRFLSF